MRLTIELNKREWLTANGRYHWAVKAKRTKYIRHKAFVAVRNNDYQPINKAHINVFIGYSTNRKADPDNSQPSVKACIDGMVDAGLFPDDNSDHILSIKYVRGETHRLKGIYRLQFDIEAVEE